MKLKCIRACFILLTWFLTNGQNQALTFQEAAQHGIIIQLPDSMYQSALNADTSMAAFKSEEGQIAMQQAYVKRLQDLGTFLSSNHLTREKPGRCFNRIYFDPGGNIDYFLFNFIGEKEHQPSMEKQLEFQRLLNLFIKDYRIGLNASTGFSQCSPVVYQPD